MGLHQAITDKNTAEPCDCGLDDDHRVYTEAESEDQLVEYREADDAELDEEEDVPEGKGFTTTEDRKHE